MKIRTSTRSLLLAATLAAGATGAALAQNAAAYDPAQLPAFKGKVAQYSLTPRGDVDGLILDDGTEVHLPPHLSTQLVFAARPGDAVTIHGLKARELPMIQAMSVTNDASGTTVVDNGPPGPGDHGPGDHGPGDHGPGDHGPGGPGAEHGPMARMEAMMGMGPNAQKGPHGPGKHGERDGRGMADRGTAMQDASTVKMPLHGPRGELNGALLADGTIVRLPPPAAQRVAGQLAAGQAVFVRGFGQASPLGKVIAVRAIGPDVGHVTELGGPRQGEPGRPPAPPAGPPAQQ